MPDRKAIAEVVATEGDVKVPIGIVSVKQALEMPETEAWNIHTPNTRRE